jgi:protein TonB
MFEDSTFESTGRIRTRSRGWMVATLLFNGTILFALILIPLIYPEALPRQALSFLLTAPPPPPQLPPKQPPQPFQGHSEMQGTQLLAPPRIPTTIGHIDGPEAPGNAFISLDSSPGTPDGATGPFFVRHTPTVVHSDVQGPVRLSSTIVAGFGIYRPPPLYPAIAKAAGVEGTVVLQAMISKNGTIENLRVASGPAMLQQAALDAVKTWRYRPYLLNNFPVEVETTVNVVFRLSR